MQSVSRAHRRNHGNSETAALTGQGNFRRYIVNSINHKIYMKLFQPCTVLRPVIFYFCTGITIFIHPPGSFRHHFRLIPAHSGEIRYKLAVDVGNIHHIFVHKDEMTHAASCQCLCRIRTDTADTENNDPFLCQNCQSLFTDQACRSLKNRIHHNFSGIISIQ